MAYSFSSLDTKIKETSEWLRGELVGIRTGQATPVLLDGIKLEVYGSMMPLNQVGSVSIEDAKTLRVSVWDQGNVKAVEKAIIDADLGVSVGSDEKGVRVSFPELTGERREQLKKIVRERLENAKVRLRHARDDTWNDIQKQQKDGAMGEDDKFRAKEDMEKKVKEGSDALLAVVEAKEKEISL